MSENIKFYRFGKLLFKYLKKRQKEMNFYVTKIFIKKKHLNYFLFLFILSFYSKIYYFMLIL